MRPPLPQVSSVMQRLRETHVRLCREWYNDFHGLKLDEGLDSTFSYQAVMLPPPIAEDPKKAD